MWIQKYMYIAESIISNSFDSSGKWKQNYASSDIGDNHMYIYFMLYRKRRRELKR